MDDMKAALEFHNAARSGRDDRTLGGVSGERPLVHGRLVLRATVVALLGVALLSVSAGCSLFVMGGRMLTGETKSKSQFKLATKVDLVKSRRKVLVLCTAADSVRTGFPSVEFDLLDGITRRLKVNGVSVVSPNSVAGWLDDHGGRFDDLQELAEHFHADYVIHIDLVKFDCNEENSPNLLRGRSEGRVQTYQLEEGSKGSAKQMLEVMNSDFVATYPAGNPISADSKSAKNFTQDYIGRVSLQVAQMFYDHPVAEEIQ